jgi:TRAP-type C4-dicarboxylate transport system substrate-binding protein
MLSAESLWINQKSWESLNAAQQEIIIKAAKVSRDWGNKELNTKILEWFELCRQKGMTIVMPPLDAWKKASQKIVADLDGKEWPKGLYDEIQKIK